MTTVIIVDDDNIDRYVARRVLEQARPDLNILEMPTGDQLVTHFVSAHWTDCPPENGLLILMDINMPGLDGFETVRVIDELSTNWPTREQLEIHMLSSSNNDEDTRSSEADPLIAGYVTKPLTKDKVNRLKGIIS